MNCRYNIEVLVNKIELIANNRNKIRLYNLDAIEFIKNNIRRTKRSLTFLILHILLRESNCIQIFMNI